ncbi:DUF5667 domain-containing protein [Anaerosolibacter sp.]|uniref:DUF5667 domain-containing protein n=1 Tax=Anaerosolibacter sp. TaxID=1872527 RepID=UPI002617832F|nr:DUF5667 domain-containing protein [Anaerosolibacter sp.]
MKKKIISGVMAGLLSIAPVFADETTITTDPGITPDSVLYSVDQLVEDIRLSMVSDIEKKAELLIAITQERLAEAKQMTEEDKIEYVNKAMEAYGERIEEAFEIVSEAVLKESIDSTVKETLKLQLEDSAGVIESVEAVVDDNQKEELAEKRDSAYLVANVVADLDQEKVITLREEKKLGYGQIAKIFLLADATGKSVEEIADMITSQGKGFGEITKELGIHPSQLKAKVQIEKKVQLDNQLEEAKTTLEGAQEELEKAIEDANEEAVKAIEKRISEIEKLVKEAEESKEKLEKELEEIKEKIQEESNKLEDEDKDEDKDDEDKDDEEDEEDEEDEVNKKEQKPLEKFKKQEEKRLEKMMKEQEKEQKKRELELKKEGKKEQKNSKGKKDN